MLILSLGLALSAAADGCRHGEGGGGWSENRAGGWGGHRNRWSIPQEEARRLNPTPVSGESLINGKAIYQANCLRCHGEEGFGDGPDAANLKVRPAILRRAAHHHSDGELAWMIRNGRDPMPAWEGKLSEEQIWDLVNYVRFEIGGGHSHRHGGRGGERGWGGKDRENCPQAERRERRGDCDRRGERWQERPSSSE
jgi:mono/diheme cytochrome c family protein